MAVNVNKDGYLIAHKVKTTKQARVDLVKAAQQLHAIGRHEQAKAMEKLAGTDVIDTEEIEGIPEEHHHEHEGEDAR